MAGTLQPEYPKSRKPRKLPLNELTQYVDEHPDAFLRENGEHFGCSRSSTQSAEEIGLFAKKTVGYKERSETAREAYQQAIGRVPVSRRIYVDESGVSH